MSEEPFNHDWLTAFAQRLALDPLQPETVTALLALAGHAARESGDRRNAPMSCFLAGLLLGGSGENPSALAVEKIIGAQ